MSSHKGGNNKSTNMQNDRNQWYRCGDIHDFHAEIQAPPSPQSFSNHHHHHHHHTGHMMLPLMPTATPDVPPQTVSSRSISSTSKASSSKSTKASKNKKPRRVLQLQKYESLPEHTVILGRGRESKENPGNLKLHALALMYLDEYSNAQNDKNMKSKLVKQIVGIIEDAVGKDQPGFVKRNKNGEWEEVNYAAAREKVGYTFRDLLADRYRSSSKSKVARLRASRASLGGTATGSDDTITPTTSGVVSPKPSTTTPSVSPKPCESDENPLEWRDDPNVSLKSVFDEVLFSAVDVDFDVEKTTSKKKSSKTNKKRNLVPGDVIKPLSVQSSSFVNTSSFDFLRSSSGIKSYDKNPILLSEFEEVFCQVFGERLATPVAASATATTTTTTAEELLPSATPRLRPRKRRVCNFIVRSGEKNSI